MDISTANILAYSAQLACLVASAAAAAAMLRIDAPAARYAYWRAALIVCLTLPWTQGRVLMPDGRLSAAATLGPATSPGVGEQVGVALVSPPFAISALIVAVLMAGAMLRLVWIAVGVGRLRRLRHIGEPAAPDEHRDLQNALGTRADVRFAAAIDHPVTFGLVRPVVLLPVRLRHQSPDVQRAVVAHELIHVQRRDWAWMLGEEFVRALFWFHPAMWWLVSRVQLAREEVVDDLAVRATGRRRAYVQALMAFADANPLAPATSFARQRHLFRRMILVSKEAEMSELRLIVTCAVMALLVAAGGWYAVAAFPLHDAQSGSVVRDVVTRNVPGPIERTAKPITPENPVPRRLVSAAPATPAQAPDLSARVTLIVTVDARGRVVESRPIGLTMRRDAASFGMNITSAGDLAGRIDAAISADPHEAASLRALVAAVLQSAVEASQRWLYDAPVEGPLAFTVPVTFGSASTPAAEQPQVNGVTALRVGQSVAPPRQVSRVPPIYPEQANAAGVQGVVIIELLLDMDGRVANTRLLRSIPLLDDAALEAVRQWEYTPTLLNGQPVPVVMTVTVNFTLAK